MKKLFLTISIITTSLFAHSQVFQEWVQRFNGTDSLFDVASAIDVNGNIYITGATRIIPDDHLVTIKYNKAGVQQWAVISNVGRQGLAIVLDNACNVYVTGLTISATDKFDFITLKYDSSGTQQWQSIYNGTLNSFDAGRAIALDNNGNVYVTGTSESDRFPTTIKYNNNGVQQWVAVYNVSVGAGQGGANAIVLDANSNVYVTGGSVNEANSSSDYTTIKYNTSGVQQWAVLFNGTGNGFDEAKSIALDKNNNVYITGLSTGAIFQSDAVTIKYNTNGVQQWVARYNGPINNDDSGVDIAIDSKGNVIVTGQSASAVDTIFCFPFPPFACFLQLIHDMLTIQYNKDGAVKWIQTYDGPAHKEDFATALTIDNKDNVYITGTSTGIGTSLDYATIKYASKGKLEWTAALQRFC